MLKYALQLYLLFLINVRKCVIKVSKVLFSVYSAQGYFSLQVCFAQLKSLNNSLNISNRQSSKPSSDWRETWKTRFEHPPARLNDLDTNWKINRSTGHQKGNSRGERRCAKGEHGKRQPHIAAVIKHHRRHKKLRLSYPSNHATGQASNPEPSEIEHRPESGSDYWPDQNPWRQRHKKEQRTEDLHCNAVHGYHIL